MWSHPQPDHTRRLWSDEPSNTPLRTPCGEAGQDPGVFPTGSGQHGPQSTNAPAAGTSFVFHSLHLLASIAGLAGCGGAPCQPRMPTWPRWAPVRGPGFAERGLRSRKPRRCCILTHFTSSPPRAGRAPNLLQMGRPRRGPDITQCPREEVSEPGPGPGSPRPNHWRVLPLKLLETSPWLEIPKITPSTTCRGDREGTRGQSQSWRKWFLLRGGRGRGRLRALPLIPGPPLGLQQWPHPHPAGGAPPVLQNKNRGLSFQEPLGRGCRPHTPAPR